jgi:hypothetical protein
MSEAIDMKKQQVQDYFVYHPDSRDVTVQRNGRIFPALFDKSYAEGSASKAEVKRKSYSPRLTCFTDDAVDIKKDDIVSFSGVEYSVFRVSKDETEETFQASIWLKVKVV